MLTADMKPQLLAHCVLRVHHHLLPTPWNKVSGLFAALHATPKAECRDHWDVIDHVQAA